MAIVSTNEIRTTTGADNTIISDNEIQALQSIIENNITNFYKVYTKPRTVIEVIDSDAKRIIQLNKPYCIQILNLKYAEKDQDLEAWYINKYPDNSIELKRNIYLSGVPFFGKYPLNIRIKYLSWFCEETEIVKEISSNMEIEPGNNVSISLNDVEDLEVNQYIMIEGTDRNREATKITNITGNDIVVNKLTQRHEVNSIITKLQIRRSLYNFILYETCLAVSLRAIGTTYTFNTSYSVEDVQATRGVPYPHFEKQVNKFTTLRDTYKQQFLNDLMVVL